MGCFVAAGCCINPTPTPPPQPVVPVDGPVPPGPSRFPDAGFEPLVGSFGSWEPVDGFARLERGPQGGGYHLSLRYRVGLATPNELLVISRIVRERDGLVLGRDDTSFSSWDALDGGARITAGSHIVRLCPARPDAGVLGEDVRLESYGYESFNARLVEATKRLRLECSGCEFDCSGRP